MSLTSQLVRGMLVSALVVGPAAAQTGDADPVEALAAQGLECFQARDFNCAIDKYKQAYAIEPVAALLYNIAFIYDKQLDDTLDNIKLARDYYFRYAKAPDPDPETKIAALERIIELEAEIRKREGDIKKPEKPIEPPKPELVPPPKTQLYAGWATLGTGVVLAGVGGVFGVLAGQSATNAWEEASTLEDQNAARDAAKTQALIADLGMAVGGAAVVTGLILVLTYDDTPIPKTEVTGVRVGPSTHGVGLSIGGAF